MPCGVWSLRRVVGLALAGSIALCATIASAAPYLVADADTGEVLMQNEATEVWYPASLTKLMTVYVALDAVRAGKLTMDTPLVVSARASRAPPSKMGFQPGAEVTLDNALKMLMVKSPNDLAITVAEGISGSVESFADAMNAAGQRLGLHESHFVNPNGLHNPEHVSSARDMAIIARALLHEFPEHADLFDIGALQLGNQIITNHNGLLGRYPGADGMKTGFTCPAGFNVVASANQNGRHLIVVVLGSPSPRLRNQEAADLFDRGFAMSGGGSGPLEFAARLRRERRAKLQHLHAPQRRRTGGRRRGEHGGGGSKHCDRRPQRRRSIGGRGQWRADSHGPLQRTPPFRSRAGLRRSGARLDRPGSRRPPELRGRRRSARRRQSLCRREVRHGGRGGLVRRPAERAGGFEARGAHPASRAWDETSSTPRARSERVEDDGRS